MRPQGFRWSMLPSMFHAAAVFAQGLPPPEVMPGMQVEWVLRDARYDDVPVHLARFSAPATAEAVLAWYRTRWHGAPPPLERRAGDDTLLYVERDGLSRSLRVRADAEGARGELVVTGEAWDAGHAATFSLPMPEGSVAVFRLEVPEDRSLASTILHRSPLSAAGLDRWIAARWGGEGWRPDVVVGDTERPGGAGMRRRYGRGGERIDVMVLDAPDAEGSYALVHRVHGP